MSRNVASHDVTPAGKQRSSNPKTRAALDDAHPLSTVAAVEAIRHPARTINAAQALHLQRAIGNRVASNLLARKGHGPFIQAKLTVGAADDPYEREAERVASQVTSPSAGAYLASEVSRGASTQPVRRMDSLPEISPITPFAQRKADSMMGSFDAEQDVERQLAANRNQGHALPDRLRAELEPRFGESFSHVRVHTGAQADQLNRMLGAQAFTHANHIYMASGKYDPASSSGKQLLAHELTHVVQQGAATKPSIQRRLSFKPEMLGGSQSVKAKLSWLLTGEDSTFGKVQKALADYWAADRVADQIHYLTMMGAFAQIWLGRHANDKSKGKGAVAKSNSLKALKGAVDAELPKAYKNRTGEKYMEKFQNFPSLVGNVTNDPLAGAAQWKSDVKKGVKTEDELKASINFTKDMGSLSLRRNLELLTKFKEYKVSAAERAAIAAYSGEQYKLMNPAMAGDKGWLKSNMANKGLDNSPAALDKALKHNRRIGQMAVSGMNKMPNWKHTRDLFRGETVTQAEGDQLKKGSKKTWPHFVSTSRAIHTPRTQIGTWVTPARPFKVIYIIKSSKSGKNIAELSSVPSEEEVLFPPHTTFKVDAVSKSGTDEKELEVSEA